MQSSRIECNVSTNLLCLKPRREVDIGSAIYRSAALAAEKPIWQVAPLVVVDSAWFGLAGKLSLSQQAFPGLA